MTGIENRSSKLANRCIVQIKPLVSNNNSIYNSKKEMIVLYNALTGIGCFDISIRFSKETKTEVFFHFLSTLFTEL